MIPISDENPTLHTPVMTWALLGAMFAVFLVAQGAGFDEVKLATSICNWGMVPGELTHRAALAQSHVVRDVLAEGVWALEANLTPQPSGARYTIRAGTAEGTVAPVGQKPLAPAILFLLSPCPDVRLERTDEDLDTISLVLLDIKSWNPDRHRHRSQSSP